MRLQVAYEVRHVDVSYEAGRPTTPIEEIRPPIWRTPSAAKSSS